MSNKVSITLEYIFMALATALVVLIWCTIKGIPFDIDLWLTMYWIYLIYTAGEARIADKIANKIKGLWGTLYEHE